MLDGYVEHVRRACKQNDYTLPRWKETRWIEREERMKLTFCTADDAEYVREWIGRARI